MYLKQCKRCEIEMYDFQSGHCTFKNNNTGIINVIECGYANDGKGGFDHRCTNHAQFDISKLEQYIETVLFCEKQRLIEIYGERWDIMKGTKAGRGYVVCEDILNEIKRMKI